MFRVRVQSNPRRHLTGEQLVRQSRIPTRNDYYLQSIYVPKTFFYLVALINHALRWDWQCDFSGLGIRWGTFERLLRPLKRFINVRNKDIFWYTTVKSFALNKKLNTASADLISLSFLRIIFLYGSNCSLLK